VTANALVLVPLGLYMLVLLGLGLWSRREGASLEGYYVAGRKLPSWVIAFSSNATGESGWLLLGLTGMGYAVGFHALWVVFGEVMGVAIAWMFVARPFKEYADRYAAITVPDYLEQRFRDHRHWLRLLSVAIILSMVTVYCCAQLIATGKAFSSFLGFSYGAGVWLGVAVTVAYTAVGGFKAVAYSDLVQGLLMVCGLVLLPIVGFAAAGGWNEVIGALQTADPNLLRAMGSHGATWVGVLSAASFAGIGLAFLGVPQLLTRFISAASGGELRRGGPIAVVCMVLFDTGAVFTGIAGRALFPVLDDPETVMPTMSAELFPAVFTGIFLVIVLGAIMSTVDSLLILASSAVVRDFAQKVLGATRGGGRLSLYGRFATVVVGAVAIPFALEEPRVLFWFVLFAWSGLGGAFVPVVLCSLFWKRTTLPGAVAGMCTGFTVTVVWVLAFKTSYYELYELIPGLIAGLAVTVIVSLWTRPPEGAAAEFDDVHAAVRGS
jgi:sodium/proline symporter